MTDCQLAFYGLRELAIGHITDHCPITEWAQVLVSSVTVIEQSTTSTEV